MPAHGVDHPSLFPGAVASTAAPGKSLRSHPETGQTVRKRRGQNFRNLQGASDEAHPLIASNGNRTYAARVLGLQRTYLLKLIREYRITVSARPRTTDNGSGPKHGWPAHGTRGRVNTFGHAKPV
jgi:hypothetical protein